jgi:alpha-beta hydrolase superfamily lysophospholipase
MLGEYAEFDVSVRTDGVELEGTLGVPLGARGIVLFAHGSGSSRFSPRNSFVAGVLRHHQLATLLIDLLTSAEDQNYETRFDIDLLTRRLRAVTTWIMKESQLRDLPLGLLGASTGAASALRLAATLKSDVAAVVSRGGRPDLASGFLSKVTAPTILIVGGDDDVVLELNQKAYKELLCQKELFVIPGATHLFEEPGTLEVVADKAAGWFTRHLRAKKEMPTLLQTKE